MAKTTKKIRVATEYKDALLADWSPDMEIDKQVLIASYKWILAQTGRQMVDIYADPAGKPHLETHAAYFLARAERAQNPVDKKRLVNYAAEVKRAIKKHQCQS